MTSVGRRRVEDEDMEGGLDEDWGHDVTVIELQSRVPDSRVKPSDSKKAGTDAEEDTGSGAGAGGAGPATEPPLDTGSAA